MYIHTTQGGSEEVSFVERFNRIWKWFSSTSAQKLFRHLLLVYLLSPQADLVEVLGRNQPIPTTNAVHAYMQGYYKPTDGRPSVRTVRGCKIAFIPFLI